MVNFIGARAVAYNFFWNLPPKLIPIKVLYGRVYVNYALRVKSKKLTKIFLGNRKFFPEEPKWDFQIGGLQSAQKFSSKKLTPHLINFPSILPSYGPKNKFEFNNHTYGLE